MAGYNKTVIVWAIVSSLGLLVLAGDSFAIFGAQQQQRTRKSTKKTIAKSPPQQETAKTPPQQESKTAEYDLDVGIEKARLGILGVIPTRFTTLVLSITNRDKRPVTIRKVMVNEEYEISGKEDGTEGWHHSSKPRVSFPVVLELGDRLSRDIYPYKKEVIYVDIETDSGVQRIKLAPRRATTDPEN